MESFALDIAFPGGSAIEANLNEVQLTTGLVGVPSPFELFLIGLGTCTGYKVLSFCQTRNLPTQNIYVKQHMSLNPTTHMIETIKFEIQLPSDFPAHYQTAMIRAAESCGVKRHLINPPEILFHTSIAQAIHTE